MSSKSIHPSIFYTRLIQFRIVGGLEPNPTVIWGEAGYTLDSVSSVPVHHRACKSKEV